MIQVNVKVHDKFSVEFKIGFRGTQDAAANDFAVNTWIFIPNSLNINNATYSKELFYRDVKSNIRLITPVFTLIELADKDSQPFTNLREALDKYLREPSNFSLREFEFHVKMFASICKSALRDAVRNIADIHDIPKKQEALTVFCDCIRAITSEYRKLADRFDDTSSAARNIFRNGDEFISHIVNIQTVKLYLSTDPKHYKAEEQQLNSLLKAESDYKIANGYSHAERSLDSNNRLVYRHSLLKKYVESVLYLKVNTSPDGSAVKQVTFGLAAGIAMIISTLIALPFQRYLGSSPFIIFIVLVIAYMFKDRIKEIVRNQFAYKLKKKYFDMKSLLDFRGQHIGWIKEGVDFVNDAKTPEEVLRLRNRSPLEADNHFFEERTLLYRKHVHIDTDALHDQKEYPLTGINDIMRFHIQHYTLKMDDPNVNIDVIDPDGTIRFTDAYRIYPLYIIMRFDFETNTEYHAFRITANRNGIFQCEDIGQ